MRRLNWTNIAFLTLTPLLAAAGLAAFLPAHGFGLGDAVAFASMMALSGIGITAGYHRCYAHRAYQCSRPLSIFYLLAGAATFEQSALVWVSEHRDHHRYVDSERDPYNVRAGFIWAHI